MNIEYSEIDRALKFKNEKLAEDVWGEETHYIYIRYVTGGKTEGVKLLKEFGYSIRKRVGADESTVHCARRVTKKEDFRKDVVDEFIMRRTFQVSGDRLVDYAKIDSLITNAFRAIISNKDSQIEIHRFHKRSA